MKWFKNAAVYQIYPRSFADSNGDGIGDLKGIENKLDYLVELGIQAIWLSPINPSPMVDFGYDVSDYCDIEPIFGNLKDFDNLVKEAHARDIKVMLDYVPNHTSDKHPWFIESRSSRKNPKRDWYMWQDSKSGKDHLPNNWLSVFGGSGWQFDPKTDSFYFHSFLREQPDLNWRNPEVKKAMENVLRFWLDRGVDGFRMDAVLHFMKDPDFRNNPLNPQYLIDKMDPYLSQQSIYSQNLPETHDILREFCHVLEDYKDRFMVTEIYASVPELLLFHKICSSKIHSPFNMNLISLPWKAMEYRKMIEEIDAGLEPEDVPNYVLGNHDRSRITSRLGESRARLAAMFQMTLRGMAFIYYGDEIAMTDVAVSPEEVQDPWEKNVPGLGLGRDPVRTPMQWNDSENGGFSSGKPWLPLSKDYLKHNVESERKDPRSMLNYYKKLLSLRKSSTALREGTYSSLDASNTKLFSYIRRTDNEEIIVIMNFSGKKQDISMIGEAEILCNTFIDAKEGKRIKLRKIKLRPYEGYVLRRVLTI